MHNGNLTLTQQNQIVHAVAAIERIGLVVSSKIPQRAALFTKGGTGISFSDFLMFLKDKKKHGIDLGPFKNVQCQIFWTSPLKFHQNDI